MAANSADIIARFTKATGRAKRINPVTGDLEKDPVTGKFDIPKLTLSPTKAAQSIIESMDLRTADEDLSEKEAKIWRYDGSVWSPDGGKEIKDNIYKAIDDLAYEKGVRETLHQVRARVKTASFDKEPFLFPALDGTIDLRTGMFREARPEDYLTFQYGAAYNNPDADYSHFLWYLATSLPDIRDCLTVIDIITAIALRIPFDIIVLLFGPGGNGKKVLEMVLIALYTISRVAAIKLGEVRKNHFAAGNLLNKDVWIVSEVSSAKDVMDILKGISSGDVLDSDVKYGHRIQGFPHVVPILDANKTFDLGDNTEGRKRRFVKMDFPFTFDSKPTNRPKDQHLEETLTTPEALSGLLQIVAARAPVLVDSKRIYLRKSAGEMDQEFKRQQHHLSFFCEECSSKEPQENPEKLTTKVLQAEYEEYCRAFNVTEPASKYALGRYVCGRFEIKSDNTSEIDKVTKKKVNVTYYPGLYLVKSAKAARAEALIDVASVEESSAPRDVDDLVARYGYYSYYSDTKVILKREEKKMVVCQNFCNLDCPVSNIPNRHP